MPPKLSICVPSRNRQIYCMETIRALTASTRTDVQFVLSDNSDEPDVMRDFIASLPDARIVFLASPSKTLSMIDNWERTVAASTGDWITVIGDDDYLDCDLAALLTRIDATLPEIEALEWSNLSYSWPDPPRDIPTNADIVLGNRLHLLPKQIVQRRAFQWEDAKVSPIGGFSIYHSAISRRLLDRIKQVCNGRTFEHPVVDFDFAFKAALVGNGFALSDRPFSVLGACPKSNSASLRDPVLVRQRNADFMAELGRNLDADSSARDFPFPSWLGVPATVMHVHLALRARHKVTVSGWEQAFVRSCVNNCEEHRDRAMFDIVTDAYRSGFARWQNGRFLRQFNPQFNEAAAGATDVFSGFSNGKLYISMPLLNAQTPAEFFACVSALVPSVDRIDLDIR
ncbi:MAG: hypothetical protein RIR97_1199 [Pseudomonadota bacterium]